jgi:hypothetical protein
MPTPPRTARIRTRQWGDPISGKSLTEFVYDDEPTTTVPGAIARVAPRPLTPAQDAVRKAGPASSERAANVSDDMAGAPSLGAMDEAAPPYVEAATDGPAERSVSD